VSYDGHYERNDYRQDTTFAHSVEKAPPNFGSKHEPRRQPRQFAETACYDFIRLPSAIAAKAAQILLRIPKPAAITPPACPKRICRRLQASDCGKVTTDDLTQAGSH
jgi:hypothetical protein